MENPISSVKFTIFRNENLWYYVYIDLDEKKKDILIIGRNGFIMSSICLKQTTKAGITLIKNLFIDYYMIPANGEYVKIYLYILRCSSDDKLSASLSINTLADIFDCTEKDVLRALKYWEKNNVLSLEFSDGVLSAIQINDLEKNGAKENEPKDTKHSKTLSNFISSARLAEFADNTEVKQLLYIAQKYMGKTLNERETNLILYFYDNLGLSADLIEYLLEYCASNDKKSFRYIEKTGITWHKEGISTPSQAKEYISNFSHTYFAVLKTFGLSGRNPAPVERDLIDKWTNQYGFSLDIIVEACNRTINTIHQPSFQYADSILERWSKNNVHHLSDLKLIDSAHEKRREKAAKNTETQIPAKKNSFNNIPQHDYDFNELEKALLKRT